MRSFAALALVWTTAALAQGFSLKIGSSVASQDFHFKAAALALRAEGCADLANIQITATAEGLVKGERRSVELKVMPASKPGIYAVLQNWGPDGDWVIAVKGVCAAETSGAIVPFNRQGFIRESAKFFSRPVKAAEIDASLKALSDPKKDDKKGESK